MKTLEVTPEQALAEDQVDGVVIALYENERPLQGLASRLDWRLRGAISRAVRFGKITCTPGEVTLVPVRKHDRIVQLVLAGAGKNDHPGERGSLPEKTVQALKTQLGQLGRVRWALSQEDLGSAAMGLAKPFSSTKGAELWVTL